MKSVAGSRRVGLLAIAALALMPAAALLPDGTNASASGAAASRSSGVVAPHPDCGGQSSPKWTCTFDDEFDHSTADAHRVDHTRWVVQQTGNSGYRTGPATHQACYQNSPQNVWVAHGRLHLRVRRTAQPFHCLSGGGLTWLVRDSDSFRTRYTAGMVSTFHRFSQAYGKFAVRAKIPKSTVPGLQETLWLFPVDPQKYGGNDWSGEIDFGEFYSQYATENVPRIHYDVRGNQPNASSTQNAVTAQCQIQRGRFNTYGLRWSPGRLALSVNGRTCLVDVYHAMYLKPPAPFDQPFIIVLTQALGVTTNAFNPKVTPLPATTVVDWVRVWKRT